MLLGSFYLQIAPKVFSSQNLIKNDRPTNNRLSLLLVVPHIFAKRFVFQVLLLILLVFPLSFLDVGLGFIATCELRHS